MYGHNFIDKPHLLDNIVKEEEIPIKEEINIVTKFIP